MEEKLFLSKEERLELQNIEFRHQLLKMSVEREASVLEKTKLDLVNNINSRLGIDLKNYDITNFETGELSKRAQGNN
jgi:hypothetical protein